MLEELRLNPWASAARTGRVLAWSPGTDRLDPNLSTGFPGDGGGRSTGLLARSLGVERVSKEEVD
jgi:hypothetical protein